jgi:hypothetical protein
MSWKRLLSRCLLGTGVVLLGTAGAVGAQNATLYEVTETMKVRGRGPENKVRAATATLAGTIGIGTELCPLDLAPYLGIEGKCGVVATASDSLNMATGTGPVRGRFFVVIHGDNKMDGSEWVIARGDIHGRIDLSAALLNGVPLGTLKGFWSAEGERGGPLNGLKLKGRVSGNFRLPFPFGVPEGCLADGDPSDCWYAGPSYLFGALVEDAPNFCREKGFGDLPNCPQGVQAHEHSLGVPTVRLDLNFETTARGFGRDRDND